MIPSSYTQDKQVVTFELYGQPDERGRRHFAIIWWMEGFHLGPQWRAQHFNSNPADYMAEWRAKGRRVVVVHAEAGR